MKRVFVISFLFYSSLLIYTAQVLMVMKTAQDELFSLTQDTAIHASLNQVNQRLIGLSFWWLVFLFLILGSGSLYVWFVTREK